MQTKDLTVNPSLRDLLPTKPLEERLALEKGIADLGYVREPGYFFYDRDNALVPTILEGHNRASIALAGDYAMEWEYVPSVNTVAEGIEWVLKRFEETRRTSDDQYIIYCLKYGRPFDEVFAKKHALKIDKAKKLSRDDWDKIYTDRRYTIQNRFNEFERATKPKAPIVKIKMPKRKVIAVIGDTQVRPGVPTFHLEWIGKYIAEKCGGKDCDIVHLGDHFDLPSLSSYDEGKRAMENRRVKEDVDAGNAAFKVLHAPIAAEMARTGWKPNLWYLLGNHCNRAERAAEDSAVLSGTVGTHLFDVCGWTMVPFLKPIVINGVHFAHYFYNQSTGRPLAGEHLKTRLKHLGFSFVQGHQQGLDFTMRPVGDDRHQAIVLGSSYPHSEAYRGEQADGPAANCYWRGIAILNRVENGMFDPAFVSLDWLAERYTGRTLGELMVEWEAREAR